MLLTERPKLSNKKKGINATLLLISLNFSIYIYFIYFNNDRVLLDDFILSYNNLFIDKRFYVIFTAGFIHGGVKHLLFNSLGLFIFGSIVEKRFGFFKTLFIYFVALIISTSSRK